MTAQLPSKLRLAQIASFSKVMALPPSHDEIEAMARALLAAHEQEPVAWRIHTPLTSVTYVELNSKSVEKVRIGCAKENIEVVITPLYAHPSPVPAVPLRTETNDQMAAVMLQHGTPAQKAQALVYAGQKPLPAYGDEYQGAREDLAIWKRRALEAEEKLRQQPAPVPAVPDDVITICHRLIKEYIANKGTSSEFICCVTPSRSTIGTGGVWGDWKALDKACRAAMLQAEPVDRPSSNDDTRRMDWLVSKTVNVREPMVYGSHDLFWSQTVSDDWEEEHKTTLREQIDAAMTAEKEAGE